MFWVVSWSLLCRCVHMDTLRSFVPHGVVMRVWESIQCVLSFVAAENNIGNEGAKALGVALEKNTALKTLDLSGSRCCVAVC